MKSITALGPSETLRQNLWFNQTLRVGNQTEIPGQSELDTNPSNLLSSHYLFTQLTHAIPHSGISIDLRPLTPGQNPDLQAVLPTDTQ